MPPRPIRQGPPQAHRLVWATVAALVLAGCSLAGATGSARLPTSKPSSSTAASALPAPSAVPSATLEPSPSTPSDPFAGQSLAPEVRITCGPDAPTLDTRRVQASIEGVRFVVTGPVGWSLGVQGESGGDSRDLETPSLMAWLLVPPGVVAVSCADPGLPVMASTTLLRIEDPSGHFRSPQIASSAGSCTTGFNEFTEDARGDAGDPVQLAAKHLTGLAKEDVVEAAGYPVERGRVRVVRAAAVIGSLTFLSDGHDGWLLSETTLCGGLAGS